MKHEQLRITQVTALPESAFHYFYNLITAWEHTDTLTHSSTLNSFSQDEILRKVQVQVYYRNK